MPEVKGKHFPYTPAGRKAAKKAAGTAAQRERKSVSKAPKASKPK